MTIQRLSLVLLLTVFQATIGLAQNSAPVAVQSVTKWPMSTDRQEKLAMMDFLELPENQDLRPAPKPNLPNNEIAIVFETLDQHVLTGTYAHTPLRQNAPLVIILHDQNEDRSMYQNFAKDLRMKGFSTFTIDLRGYGDSTKKTDGTDFLAQDFQTDSASTVFREMQFDVDAVLDYVYDNKIADDEGVFLVGSVIGASVSCMAGIRNAHRLDGIVLVSPYMIFRQIFLDKEVEQIQGLPMLVLVGENDNSRRTVPRVLNRANNDVKSEVIPGHEFGIRLLEKPDSLMAVNEFIEKHEDSQ